MDPSGLYSGTVKMKNSGVTDIYTWADVFMVRITISDIVAANTDTISHYDFNDDSRTASTDYVVLKNRLKAIQGAIRWIQ